MVYISTNLLRKLDKKDGSGVLFSKEGTRYEGEFLKDFKAGKGTEFFADFSEYSGIRCNSS